MPNIIYTCEECFCQDHVKFSNSQDECYADDVMIERGWWKAPDGKWYCPECVIEGAN